VSKKFEVHEHYWITGRQARMAAGYKFYHSHEGGDGPHEHVEGDSRTGPASYTIDKRDWLRATGSVGGSEKKFSAKPTGPQLPFVKTEPTKVRIVVVGDGGASVARDCSGPGVLPVARIVLGFRAKIESVEHVPGPGLKQVKKGGR